MSVNPEGNKKYGKKELIALVADHLLFVDEYEVSHIFLNQEGYGALRIESKAFKSWLRVRFYERYQKTPSKVALEEAVYQIASLALVHGKTKKYKLKVRVAHIENDSYLDLKNDSCEVVKITPHKAQIIQSDIPIFRQFRQQKALPIISCHDLSLYQKEHLDIFFDLVSVKKTEDRILLVSWIVAVLISDKPKPILCFHGPKGAGKSSASEAIKMLLDPSENPRVHVSNEKDLALSLSQNGILLLDNKTGFRDDVVNMMCMAVTKGSFVARELYSDYETVSHDFYGAVIVNGINIPSNRADLLERLLMIELSPIQKSERKTEKILQLKFETYKDDLLLQFIHIAREVKYKQWSGYQCLDEKPRLADFYEICEMVGVILGHSPQFVKSAYEQNELRQEMEILEKPLFRLMRKFAEETKVFSGTATELFQKLRELDENAFKNSLRRVNENVLGKFINEHMASFEKIGVHIEKEKTTDGRLIHISLVEKSLSFLSELSSSTEKVDVDNKDTKIEDYFDDLPPPPEWNDNPDDDEETEKS